MMVLFRLVIGCGLAGLLLTSCTLTPEYRRPELPVAATVPFLPAAPAAGMEGSSADTPADLGWRDYFTDPRLQQMIALALEANRDLEVSALSVAAYQARYRIQRSALFPAVDATASALRQRTLNGDGHATGAIYETSVGLTAYELDFFGRLRNLQESALEQYLAIEANHRSATINLVAEVAGTYLVWLADRELFAISEHTRDAEEDSYDLVAQRVRAGIANELDLAQARTSLETVKADLALYRRRVAQDVNYLSLLTGTEVTGLLAQSDSMLDSQLIVTDLPAFLPSEVLLQRPDITAAEHELKGANADIGAARAAFFPAITLTAKAGVISTDLADQFDGDSGLWLFAPSIRLPLFTAGRLRAELDGARIRKDISVARYEQAIQTAFREVADALVAADTYREQVEAQAANVAANEDYHAMARQRYQEGLDNFLPVLDAQRSLYRARQYYLTLRLAQLINQVDFYKALGGGWKERS